MFSSADSCLAGLGWDDDWAAALADHRGPPLFPGRVSRTDRGVCTVLTPDVVRVATGRHRVATGDWVAIAPGDPPCVAAVLPRRGAFMRERAGPETAAQVLAANVDVVFVVGSLIAGFSPRRIERYLTLAWQSAGTPVVVLTKADCCPSDDTVAMAARAQSVAVGVEVHCVSALTGAGIDRLAGHLAPGRTVALLGPSGAGKSTLVNCLAGAEVMPTAEVRGDGKGRHTTTHRELVVLPGRGLLLDTPGLRGLALWDADEGLSRTFDDVESLTGACRFSDCRHESEPGCAVLGAIEDGSLSEARLASWRKLQRELRALAARQGDRAAREDNLRRWKAIAKAGRHRDPRRDRR